MLGVALLSGRFVNLNYISVQRCYRDRLMEVFMPDIDDTTGERARHGGPAPEADGQRLSDCLDQRRYDVPYPLFNTHMPLAAATSRRRRLRGGDNVILSPLYCDSSATGWRRTGRFMDDGMMLPSAMTISGSVIADSVRRPVIRSPRRRNALTSRALNSRSSPPGSRCHRTRSCHRTRERPHMAALASA